MKERYRVGKEVGGRERERASVRNSKQSCSSGHSPNTDNGLNVLSSLSRLGDGG